MTNEYTRIPLASLPMMTYDELEVLAVLLENEVARLRPEGISHALIMANSLVTAVREAQYSIRPPDDGAG